MSNKLYIHIILNSKVRNVIIIKSSILEFYAQKQR